jgi:acetylglutamate kinase
MKKLENTISISILPYISKYKNKTFVIKYGGSIMSNTKAQKAFIQDVSILKSFGINIVLVHGGGPEINKWLQRSGVESRFIKGLRVTDSETMEIVEMVLSGNVNKKLAANLSGQGLNALGISGRDNNLIKARKKYLYEGGEKVDIGFVGEVVSIQKKLLLDLLDKDQIPVISPIGCDAKGNTYNINADYAASAVAAALKAEKLIIMTDIEGVYRDINDKSSLITSITIDEIRYHIASGIINGGMIPKMECCMDAILKGTKNVHLIDGRKEHSLILDTFTNSGTKIISRGGIEQCQKAI